MNGLPEDNPTAGLRQFETLGLILNNRRLAADG